MFHRRQIVLEASTQKIANEKIRLGRTHGQAHNFALIVHALRLLMIGLPFFSRATHALSARPNTSVFLLSGIFQVLKVAQSGLIPFGVSLTLPLRAVDNSVHIKGSDTLPVSSYRSRPLVVSESFQRGIRVTSPFKKLFFPFISNRLQNHESPVTILITIY